MMRLTDIPDGPGDDIATVLQCLAETIRWVKTRRPFLNRVASLRSDALLPASFVGDRRALIEALSAARHNALPAPEVSALTNLEGGRLAAYIPDDNLWDGAAEIATRGFLDGDNTPPWDTWAGYIRDPGVNGYVVCWIPPEMVDVIADGIDVNPEWCIRWLEDVDGPTGPEILSRVSA
jgi:hypothetical protein